MVMAQNLAGTGESLDDSLQTILADFRLLTQEEGGITRSTASPMTLNPGEGASKNVRNYGRVTAVNVDYGVDLAQAAQLSDTPTSFTPGEVGVQVILSGQALRQSADRDLMRRTSRMLFNAWDIKEDTDGLAQFTSFSVTLGAAGTVMSPGHLAASESRLAIGNDRTNPEPAEKPWFTQMHPLSATVLRGRLAGLSSTPGGAAAFGAEGGAHAGVTIANNPNAMQMQALGGPGAIGSYGQLIIKENANISVDGSDDAVGGSYSKETLVYVTEVAPRMDPDTSDKSMRGAIELNLWGSYGWGLYRQANKAVRMTFDASLPTS